MRQSGRRPQSGPPFYFSFVFLFYLAFPLYEMFNRPIGEMMVGLVLVVIFGGLYIYSSKVKKGRIVSVFVQLAIITLFSFRYGAGFIYLAFFPSPIIGLLPSKKQMYMAIGIMVTLFISVGWHYKLYLSRDDMIQLVPAMLVMLFLPFGIRLGQKSRELREKLYLANEEIARLSKNEERQRISRDLHDTLGHTLSLITLKSELAEKLIVKNPERAIKEVKDIQTTSRAALKQVRELVSGMNAVTIRDELVHAKQILAAANISLEVRGQMNEGSAQPLVDNILGMCLREAVTNAVKYSRARTLKVEWTEEPSRFKLVVADDGVGVDIAACESVKSGSGLRGLKERLKLVEGDLNFESVVGRGVTVTFTVPLVTKSIETGESNR
jgi:two-component system sensor histidine kinase DesK